MIWYNNFVILTSTGEGKKRERWNKEERVGEKQREREKRETEREKILPYSQGWSCTCDPLASTFPVLKLQARPTMLSPSYKQNSHIMMVVKIAFFIDRTVKKITMPNCKV
jgi:hypothetical protein